jgi:glucose-6-phosphate 1-epimerase
MTSNAPSPVPTTTSPTPDVGPAAGAPDVRVDTGRGGLPRVLVRTPAASAEVYLHGAHVTAWAPAGQAPVIWTSEHSTFAPGAPIRGGVPVCFPWFGADPSGAGPLHGVVRLLPWRFTGWEPSGDDVVLRFALSSVDLDGAAPFTLSYTVTVGARLTLTLEVANTGPAPLRFQDALNIHLAVPDVTAVVIDGLGGLERLDRLTGRPARVPVGAGMRIVAETDHLYRRPGPVTVTDWEGGRRLDLRFPGAGSAVVWNPWADRAATMADMGGDAWTRMVGVGPGDIADAAVVLAPGATHVLTATIDVGALS